MIHHDFTPRGVCSRAIHVDLSDDGRPVEEVVSLLQGNTCGPRPTSCADQMTKAILEAAAKAE